jgi:hypothetical protein
MVCGKTRLAECTGLQMLACLGVQDVNLCKISASIDNTVVGFLVRLLLVETSSLDVPSHRRGVRHMSALFLGLCRVADCFLAPDQVLEAMLRPEWRSLHPATL